MRNGVCRRRRRSSSSSHGDALRRFHIPTAAGRVP
jgi:hypothetical protein